VARRALGKVVDTQSLDESDGPAARLEIDIPRHWLDEGGELEIAAPRRLTCARCDGGGCDACERSGALNAPDDADRRKIAIHLPQKLSGTTEIRVADPFVDNAIEQLMVRLSPGSAASEGVRRVRHSAPPTPMAAKSTSTDRTTLLLATAIVVALIALLLARL
jgi:hypothetical protein